MQRKQRPDDPILLRVLDVPDPGVAPQKNISHQILIISCLADSLRGLKLYEQETLPLLRSLGQLLCHLT